MWLKRLIIAAFALGAIVAVAMYTLDWPLTHVQRPHSDVPIISEIGSWPYQQGTQIDGLKVTVVHAPLNLFNNKALVRFRITGSLASAYQHSRPYVKSVQLSQRVAGGASDPHGDLQLVPVIGVREDKRYSGQRIAFDVAVEQVIETMDWGNNRYVVSAGDQRGEFVLQQPK